VYVAEAPVGSYSVAAGAAGYIGQTANVVLAGDRPAIRDFELVKDSMIITLRGISFDAGTATIRPESKAALNDAAKILSDNPSIRAEIQGHTDNRGSAESSLKLSEKRALAVVGYLVENNGIDALRLTAKGYGESAPIADNDTKEGRAANQRIELVVSGVAEQK
jgi:outer membrane protein OmpA-like peptidoglycan-associated protein